VRILCLGASFTGRYLARNFPEHQVDFLSRDPDAVRAEGLSAFTPGQSGQSQTYDLILDCLPALPDANGKRPAPHPYMEIVGSLLEGASAPRVIHISSTSVYPAGIDSVTDAEDAPRFDESVTPVPPEERGQARLRLEEGLIAAWPGLLIIRASGIYGPARCLALSFQKGDFRRARSAGNKLVSRIHVHDLCRLALALSTADDPPAIVNAVDRRPTANREVFSFLEERLGITLPGADWRGDAPSGRAIASRYTETLLGGTYRFPTYREGFEHALESDG
jgi:nucleoside-diphosphate-sugar epimerase